MRGLRHAWLGLGLGVMGLGLLAAAPARALVIPLDVEFDTGATGRFGTVVVTRNGDDLDFAITVGPGLDALGGGRPDLHRFYFNLAGSFADLRIVAHDAPRTAYRVSPARGVSGGAGARFDFVVSFGNGGGPKGNGTLSSARFTLSAAQPLRLADLSKRSFPNAVDAAVNPIHFALHVQGTAAFRGSSSETVGGGGAGGVVPEPGTGLLLVAGLAALALGTRRR